MTEADRVNLELSKEYLKEVRLRNKHLEKVHALEEQQMRIQNALLNEQLYATCFKRVK